jgi:hypothetical protein
MVLAHRFVIVQEPEAVAKSKSTFPTSAPLLLTRLRAGGQVERASTRRVARSRPPWSSGRVSTRVDFRDIDHADYLAVSGTMLDDVDLVVMEGGGYVGVNAAASLGLARVRERFATSAWYEDIQYVEVSPTQWRVVLELPTQPRSRAVAGQRDMCNMLSKPRHSPVLPLAHLAKK